MAKRTLLSLRPEWLAVGEHRYGMGVSLACPGHAHANHRIRVWFSNPSDGEEALPAALWGENSATRRFWRLEMDERGEFAGSELERLSLYCPWSTGCYIEVPGHWRGRVIDGQVEDAAPDS